MFFIPRLFARESCTLNLKNGQFIIMEILKNDFFPNMPEIRERTIELKKKLENEKRMEYEKRRNMSSEPGLVSKEKMDS